MTDRYRMVIANRLRDGFTVFLDKGGGWVESIDEAAVAASAGEGAALLATATVAADRNIVVNPYLIDVTDAGGHFQPVEWRESIRAFGPTIPSGAPG